MKSTLFLLNSNNRSLKSGYTFIAGFPHYAHAGELPREGSSLSQSQFSPVVVSGFLAHFYNAYCNFSPSAHESSSSENLAHFWESIEEETE
jgi:hypothetical protein